MLKTEADILRVLTDGTYTLDELYRLCDQRADTTRDGGEDRIADHGDDRVWKRRVRSMLMRLKEQGRAERIDRSVWAIRGNPSRPRRLMLIVAGGDPHEFELRVQQAVELLADLDEPADLICVDPPYGLGRGSSPRWTGGRGYRRDHRKVIGGYQEIDPGCYREFTHEWVTAAADALRPAGQLAVITGPQQAAAVQIAAEDAGLTWVSQVAARKAFPLRTTRRPANAHWCITILTRGALHHPRRVFNCPADLPKARSGADYPLSFWTDNGRADRRGDLLRYDNALPLKLVCRVIEAFSDPGELVVDPMLGSGTTAIAAWATSRRFVGGDVNDQAVRFAAARLLDEHAWPREDAGQPVAVAA